MEISKKISLIVERIIVIISGIIVTDRTTNYNYTCKEQYCLEISTTRRSISHFKPLWETFFPVNYNRVSA